MHPLDTLTDAQKTALTAPVMTAMLSHPHMVVSETWLGEAPAMEDLKVYAAYDCVEVVDAATGQVWADACPTA